jgi:hypothetical protein
MSEDSVLAAIRRLHARHDGAIPKPAREAALAGGAARLRRLKAEARRRMYDGLAREAGAALATRRRRLASVTADADGILLRLGRDLRFYRDRGVARRKELEFADR